MISAQEIKDLISKNNGILMASSAKVFRQSYFGNNIIAPNSEPIPGKVDARGYLPVELWIMSTVEAENPIKVPGEGITNILLGDSRVPLTHIEEVAGDFVFGQYSNKWPLTKILDIGGEKVKTSFGTQEVPPIPAHVHAGTISSGKVQRPGKHEAYFFPPLDVNPYHKEVMAKTRIGLKPETTKEEVKNKLKEFGQSDSMFELLNEFEIEPMTGWSVPAGILHAPGPYLTFEIQLPQDDYNLASWRLGERLSEPERQDRYQKFVLRGLKNEDEYIDLLLDWQATTHKDFKNKYFHKPDIIENGSWGRRMQIFFDTFYGEAWEILPGQTMKASLKNVPIAGVIWSGQANINGNHLSQKGLNEFLSIPNTNLIVSNPGDITLMIYTVEPIKNYPKN